MKKYVCLCLSFVLLTACRSYEIPVSSTKYSEHTQDIDWFKAAPDARQYQITFETVRNAVANGAKFYDVRSSAAFQESNFGITENLPLIDVATGKLPDLDKDTPIYIHCSRSVCSAQAVALFRKANFTHVYDLGGLEQVEVIGGQLIQK